MCRALDQADVCLFVCFCWHELKMFHEYTGKSCLHVQKVPHKEENGAVLEYAKLCLYTDLILFSLGEREV